jgi:hypothetical protein
MPGEITIHTFVTLRQTKGEKKMDANLLKAYQLFNNINNTDFSMGEKGIG